MPLVAVLVWVLSFGGVQLATVSAEHLQLLLEPGSFLNFIYLSTLPSTLCSYTDEEGKHCVWGESGYPRSSLRNQCLQTLSMAKCWWREEWETWEEFPLQLPHAVSILLFLMPRPLSVHGLTHSQQRGLSEGS